MHNKLVITNLMESTPIEIDFTNNGYSREPKSLEEWHLVFMGYILGSDGIADDIDLYFNGKHYILNEDGDGFVEYKEEKDDK